MRHRFALLAICATLATVPLTAQSIYSTTTQPWFDRLDSTSQRYFSEGYRHGVWGMSKLIEDWLKTYEGAPQKGFVPLRLLIRLGPLGFTLEDDYYRMMILYPPRGGDWQTAVLRETLDILIQQLKETPNGNMAR